MTTKSDDDFAKALIVILLIPSMFLLMWIDALMLRDLWRYFAVTALNLPRISVAAAFGFNLLFSAFKHDSVPHMIRKLTEEKVESAQLLFECHLSNWLSTLLFWGMGALVYHWWIA